MSSFGIRPSEPSDYPVLAGIWNACYPMWPVTAAELRKEDSKRPPAFVVRRFLLHLGARPVGFGAFLNTEDAFDPRRFRLDLAVHPTFHGQGLGKALYGQVVAALEPLEPRELLARSRADFGRKTRFLLERGFLETLRSFESSLDPEAFDPTPYRGLEERLERKGIVLKDAAQLRGDPDFRHESYRLHTLLDRDVPMPGDYTPPSFERFQDRHFDHPRFLPEGFLVASDGDRYVGMTELFRRHGHTLETGLTGVLGSHRRQGIALALKVKSIAVARRLGARRIHTWNASVNRGMLAINERLGFRKQPATIDFLKRWSSASTEPAGP